MNYNFKVNIDSVEKLSDVVQKTSGNMDEILDYLIRITNDMDMFFDTPSEKILNEALLRYLNQSKETCKTLKDLSNSIKLFNKNYNSIYNATRQSIGEKV